MLAHLNFTLPKGWCRQYQQDPTRSFSPVVSFNPQEALDCLIHASTKPEKCDMLLEKKPCEWHGTEQLPIDRPIEPTTAAQESEDDMFLDFVPRLGRTCAVGDVGCAMESQEKIQNGHLGGIHILISFQHDQHWLVVTGT